MGAGQGHLLGQHSYPETRERTMVADVVFSTEGLAIIGILLSALVGAVTMLFKLLIAAKDQAYSSKLAELESVKKSYQEIAAEAVKSAVDTTNFYRAKEGKPPVLLVAPVISESHSPSTLIQREVAAIQTLRATVAQVKLEENQPPRKEPDRAVSNDQAEI